MNIQVGDTFINTRGNVATIIEVNSHHIKVAHPSGTFDQLISIFKESIFNKTYTNYKSILENEKERITHTEESVRGLQIRKSNQKRQIATSSRYTGNRVSYRGSKNTVIKAKVSGSVCSF